MEVENRTRYSVHQHRNHLLAMAGTVPEDVISRDELVSPQAYVEDVVGLVNHSDYSAGRCHIFKGKLNRDGYGRVKQTGHTLNNWLIGKPLSSTKNALSRQMSI